MVRFLPYDQSDEESMNIVLQHIDFAIQYGEDLEFKEPRVSWASLCQLKRGPQRRGCMVCSVLPL
jgi:hypothetical protein